LTEVSHDTLKILEQEADKTIYMSAPKMFFSVGQFYQQFEQVNDNQVIQLLTKKN